MPSRELKSPKVFVSRLVNSLLQRPMRSSELSLLRAGASKSPLVGVLRRGFGNRMPVIHGTSVLTNASATQEKAGAATVLLVEDPAGSEAFVRDAAARYRVVCATMASEAFEIVQRGGVDLTPCNPRPEPPRRSLQSQSRRTSRRIGAAKQSTSRFATTDPRSSTWKPTIHHARSSASSAGQPVGGDGKAPAPRQSRSSLSLQGTP